MLTLVSIEIGLKVTVNTGVNFTVDTGVKVTVDTGFKVTDILTLNLHCTKTVLKLY